MEPHDAPAAQPAGTAPLRVLVADDEPLIRAALQRLLERRGHDVSTAASASEAIAFLETGSYDAVMVDWRMPGGGASVLAWLQERRFAGRVFLMTGEMASDAEEVGDGVRCLQKPFRFPSVIPLLEEGSTSA